MLRPVMRPWIFWEQQLRGTARGHNYKATKDSWLEKGSCLMFSPYFNNCPSRSNLIRCVVRALLLHNHLWRNITRMIDFHLPHCIREKGFLLQIDIYYPNHPKSRITIKDDSRLGCTSQEVFNWVDDLSKFYSYSKYEKSLFFMA